MGLRLNVVIFWRFEPQNVLNMFLKLCGIVFQKINAGVTRKTYQSALFAVMWYQVACHVVVRLALMPRTRCRCQPTFAKFILLTKKIEQNKEVSY